MRIPVGNSRINPLTDVLAGVSGARYRCAVRFFNLKKKEYRQRSRKWPRHYIRVAIRTAMLGFVNRREIGRLPKKIRISIQITRMSRATEERWAESDLELVRLARVGADIC